MGVLTQQIIQIPYAYWSHSLHTKNGPDKSIRAVQNMKTIRSQIFIILTRQISPHLWKEDLYSSVSGFLGNKGKYFAPNVKASVA